MGTADIEAAIKSTPQMKEELRKAYELLQSYSSSVVSFTLQWKDLEDHFASIEKSIAERFRELKELDSTSVEENSAGNLPALKFVKKVSKAGDVDLHQELKVLCGKMDGEGLISFITENKKDIVILKEVGPALLSAPDPVNLVLDSLACFSPSEDTTDGKLQSIRRTCASILECFSGLALEINPEARNRAWTLAAKLQGMIRDGKGDNSTTVLSFLRLIVAFGLVDSFEVDYILDLLVLLVKRQYIIDLCKNSAFVGMVPSLIDRLKTRGKQLDAVKFVLAFNLQAKYPPASLLKEYIKESKQAAQEEARTNSSQSKGLVSSTESDALKAVIRTVAEYKLESAFPCEGLHKRIEQLERQKMEKKRGPPAGAASNSNIRGPKQLQPPPNKRPRPSDSFALPFAALPPPRSPVPLGPADRAPYMGSAAPSLYIHGNSSLPGEYVGFSGSHATLSPYAYPTESHGGSGYYDRAAVNGGYKMGLGLAPAYNPSLYP